MITFLIFLACKKYDPDSCYTDHNQLTRYSNGKINTQKKERRRKLNYEVPGNFIQWHWAHYLCGKVNEDVNSCHTQSSHTSGPITWPVLWSSEQYLELVTTVVAPLYQ